MNYSKQREALLNILRGTKSHPTASEIYDKLHETDPRISLGTVYRNLALLAENGMIMRIDTDHDSAHYDGCTDPHYHFVCDRCKRVSDIDIDPLVLDREVAEKYGCSVSRHSLIFYGECRDCKSKFN